MRLPTRDRLSLCGRAGGGHRLATDCASVTVESWAGFSTVPAPRTAVALAARHRSADAALGRVRDAIIRLRRERTQVSVAAVARRANVSRTFLYDHPDARAAVAAVMAEAGERRTQMVTDQDEAHEATWRERALNAEDALRAAHAEIIAQQRTRNGELLRQVGDLEAEWTQEANQRITTENTTLKQRVRQLTADNRSFDERLKAARSNLWFQVRRVADLEARIAAPPGG